MKGFLFSYRGSSVLFNKMKARITAALHEFSVGELSEIAKAYHITENEDPEFMNILERSSSNSYTNYQYSRTTPQGRQSSHNRRNPRNRQELSHHSYRFQRALQVVGNCNINFVSHSGREV